MSTFPAGTRVRYCYWNLFYEVRDAERCNLYLYAEDLGHQERALFWPLHQSVVPAEEGRPNLMDTTSLEAMRKRQMDDAMWEGH